MKRHTYRAALLAALVPACTGNVSGDQDAALAEEVVGEAEGAIIQADTKASFAGTVQVGGCTATVLSEHWVLTAAHCVENWPFDMDDVKIYASFTADGNPYDDPAEKIYDGPAKVYRHPSWGGGDTDREYDVGLLRLTSYGIDTTKIGRVKLNAGTSSVPSSNMIIAGFGYGTAPGGSSSCDAGTFGVLRYDSQTVTGSSSTLAWTDDDIHCPGDSGGPWLSYFISGGHQYIQFAVHGGNAWDLSKGWHERAATIKSTRSWIESKMQANVPFRFGYSVSPGSFGGMSYRTYNESGMILSPLKIAGWCVEPDGWGNGSSLVLRACDGSDEQLWWLKATGEIKHPVSNRCMSVSAGVAQNQTPMLLWDCYDVPAYRFRQHSDLLIHSGVDYDKCVDVQWGNFADGTPLWLWDCTGSVAQVFDFTN